MINHIYEKNENQKCYVCRNHNNTAGSTQRNSYIGSTEKKEKCGMGLVGLRAIGVRGNGVAVHSGEAVQTGGGTGIPGIPGISFRTHHPFSMTIVDKTGESCSFRR